MRNELKYPVTKKEIAEYLDRIFNEKLDGLAPGDMDCVLLDYAKRIVEKHGDEFLKEQK